MSERLAVLVNPRAGGGRARSLWERVRKQLPRLAALDRIDRRRPARPAEATSSAAE